MSFARKGVEVSCEYLLISVYSYHHLYQVCRRPDAEKPITAPESSKSAFCFHALQSTACGKLCKLYLENVSNPVHAL